MLKERRFYWILLIMMAIILVGLPMAQDQIPIMQPPIIMAQIPNRVALGGINPLYRIAAQNRVALGGINPLYRIAAQNWVALPPYNILWPLWSPVLSPPNATGTPVPLISELTSSTILPVQPCLVYDPYWKGRIGLVGPAVGWPMGWEPPWLVYNSPTGVVFFDILYGLNPWPPESYLDSITGAPVPIELLAGYTLIEPTPRTLPTTKAHYLFELGNLNYMIAYGFGLGIDPTSLLTQAEVWGLLPW
jgi:hypothetical protein